MHSWNLHTISRLFNKKIRFIAQLFRKLHPPKIVVTWKFHSSCFRKPFASQQVNGFQTLLKQGGLLFLPNFLLMSEKLSLKKSFLVRSWILGPCFTTLANYHIYSRQNWKKLGQKVQKHISSKLLPFYQYFIAFLEFTYNFAHFQEKDGLDSSIISEVTSSKDCNYLKVPRLPFQKTLQESKCSLVPNTP